MCSGGDTNTNHFKHFLLNRNPVQEKLICLVPFDRNNKKHSIFCGAELLAWRETPLTVQSCHAQRETPLCRVA